MSDIDHPADFIRGLPLLKTAKERGVAQQIASILEPLSPRQRAGTIAKLMASFKDGHADGEKAATKAFKEIATLPPEQRAEALHQLRESLELRERQLMREQAATKAERYATESDLALLTGLRDWLTKPMILESPHGSAWHKVQEAEANSLLYTLKVDDSGFGKLNFDAASTSASVQVFVVEHDWARAFASAKDVDGGVVRLPFDWCVFEFRIAGRRVCVLLGNASASVLGEFVGAIGSGVLFVSGENDRWCALGPPHSDGPLADLINAQVRAVCIALDAEVAITEVERAPAKLNEARAKKGKPPLKDYHVVSLARRSRAAPLPRSGDEPQWHKRMHFVRGHWRHYEASKTWIRWHLRGNPDLGFIDKHYKL